MAEGDEAAEQGEDSDASSRSGVQYGDYVMEDACPITPKRAPRSFKMRRMSSCLVDDHVEQHLKRMPLTSDTQELLLAGLRKNRFCSSLDPESLKTLVRTMEHFEFDAGETIMTQGTPGKYFYIIQYGTCDLIVNGEPVEVLESGASFGGMALLYGTSRTSTVQARMLTGLWGASGSTLRSMLREHSKRHLQENRDLLEQIRMFDGMSAQGKERLSKVALLTETYEAGKVVLRHSTAPIAVYVVKSGTLFFRSPSGTRLQTLRSGDCFGWRAVSYGELESSDVVVEERCELVGVGVSALQSLLGKDLGKYLMQTFAMSVLRKAPALSQLHPKLLKAFVERIEAQALAAGQGLEEGTVLAIVVDGNAGYAASTGGGDNGEFPVQRGRLYQDPVLLQLDEQLGGATNFAATGVFGGAAVADLVAPPGGYRLATLTSAGLRQAAVDLGLALEVDDQNPLAYFRKGLLLKKIPVFRELSISQLDGVVSMMEDLVLPPRTEVFGQGQQGEEMYLIKEGALSIVVDGEEVQQVGAGACIGERALLSMERRAATVVTMDEEVHAWRVRRHAFKGIISDSMREQMVRTLNRHGTHFSLRMLKHVRLIGAGSFGSVRLVEHKKTAHHYALKRIRKKNGQVPEEVARECALLAENAHPFMLQYVDQFEGESSVYILTELVAGGQLYQQVLDKMGVLSRRHAQFYVGSIAMTLEALHDRHIVFRDLKPENIMLDMQGYIKLVDFGLAKRLDEAAPRTFTCSGTAFYMAPEVIQGNGYATECDIWSLGVIFYELVCGEVPFGRDADDIPGVLAEIIEEPLEIPARYNDSSGKKLMQGLLCKEVEQRLGSGQRGMDEVKSQKFFKQGVSGNLFSMIAGREIRAPIVPEQEDYTNEANLFEQGVTLSDAEELGKDEPADMGCKLLALFKKFDANGDGSIDRRELGAVLGALDSNTFTEKVCDALMEALDEDKSGSISYEEFVSWMLGDSADQGLLKAIRGAFKLDLHA